MTFGGNSSKGFAAVAAIFLVLILAAFGAFMVSVSNTQHLNSAQDMQGSRAYWAARAGLEWGIASVAASAATPPVCTTSPTLLGATFDGGFAVTVTCSRADYVESSVTRYLFTVTSVASTGSAGSVGFIERSMSATMER